MQITRAPTTCLCLWARIRLKGKTLLFPIWERELLLYQAVLSGANRDSAFGNCVVTYFGYEYQSCSTWTSSTQWTTWLSTTGATGRMHLGNLMNSREFWKMVPDINHTVAVAGFGSGDTITATSRTSDGQTIIAYISNGRALTVDMSQITSATSTAICWWFNPSDGATKMIGAYANSGTRDLHAPRCRRLGAGH